MKKFVTQFKFRSRSQITFKLIQKLTIVGLLGASQLVTATESTATSDSQRPKLVSSSKSMNIYEAEEFYIAEILDPNPESWNKPMSDFNLQVHRFLQEPAEFYTDSPLAFPLRFPLTILSNEMNNATELILTTASNLLAGEFEQAGTAMGRSLLNYVTTGGTYNLANTLAEEEITDPSVVQDKSFIWKIENGLRSNVPELRETAIKDLNGTFEKWGFGCGTYWVIPFLGGSTSRGLSSKVAQIPLMPETYIQPLAILRIGATIHDQMKEVKRSSVAMKIINTETTSGETEYYKLVSSATLASHHCLDPKVIKQELNDRGYEVSDDIAAETEESTESAVH